MCSTLNYRLFLRDLEAITPLRRAGLGAPSSLLKEEEIRLFPGSLGSKHLKLQVPIYRTLMFCSFIPLPVDPSLFTTLRAELQLMLGMKPEN